MVLTYLLWLAVHSILISTYHSIKGTSKVSVLTSMTMESNISEKILTLYFVNVEALQGIIYPA